jgi:hypothetical protein
MGEAGLTCPKWPKLVPGQVTYLGRRIQSTPPHSVAPILSLKSVKRELQQEYVNSTVSQRYFLAINPLHAVVISNEYEPLPAPFEHPLTKTELLIILILKVFDLI